MKKLLIVFLILCLCCAMLSATAAITTLTTQVSKGSDSVTVSGEVTGGADKQVNISLTNPSGSVVYTGEALSDANGNYKLIIPMNEDMASGTYTVTATTPTEITFEHEGAEQEEPTQPDTNSEISANLNINGNNVTITGTTGAGSDKEVTLFVQNPTGGIAYIDQVTSGDNGAFEFAFSLPEDAAEGSYTAKFGGTSVSAPRVINFTYPSTDTGDTPIEPDEPLAPDTPDEITNPNENNLEVYSKSKFVEADITVTLASYVPTLTGTISCIQGKNVDIKVINTTDNTVIIDDTVTYEDGEYAIYYKLPSLVSQKDYSLNISAGDDDNVQTVMNVNIDTGILLVKIDGNVQVDDNVQLDARLETVNTDLIDKTTSISSDKSISVTLPNVVSNSSYHFEVQCYERYTEDMVTEIKNSENLSLYNALKNARPELDEDDDGIITQTELSGITGVLDLSDAGIEKIIGLGQCTGITGLILKDNNISSLRPLSFLSNLDYVDARNNVITNISTMPENLRYLNIDNNFVEGLQGLKKANKLEVLSAAHNKITSAVGLGNKAKLRYLKLNNNLLTDISALIGCKMLVHLDISDNSISDTAVLDDLRYIYYLDLENNLQ